MRGLLTPGLRSHIRSIALLTLIQLIIVAKVLAAPALLPDDRTRLTEYFRLNQALRKTAWPGWTTAPDAILLVCDSAEFLIRHPAPTADFKSLGNDALLGSDVLWRPRSFQPNLQATFPALGLTVTIVVGRAEATQSKTSTPWIFTLAHEHFHQWQMSQPWYNKAVDSLGLSGGDKTGMWMLNYPFPYDSTAFAGEFAALQRQLIEMLDIKKPDSLQAHLKAYLADRAHFLTDIGQGPARYFSFQLWQEGIARYVELRIAQQAAKSVKPSAAFRSLPDFEPFDAVAQHLRKTIIDELSTLKLSTDRRLCFYSFGAAEGLILDRLLPNWQVLYAQQRFHVEKLMEIALAPKSRK